MQQLNPLLNLTNRHHHRNKSLPTYYSEAGDQGGGAAVSGNGDVNGSGAIDIADASYLLNWLFLGGPDPEPCESGGGEASGLPDTGQMTCYDQNGNVIDCASDTAREDGFYATGCPSEGRFSDNGDGTVTDTCTGLMWQQVDGGRLNWGSALEYCENLELGDHDDWRLPNVRELQSIVDFGRLSPSIDRVFSASSSNYWSSTSRTDDPVIAWHVFFHLGIVGHSHKDLERFVRAVRSGP